MSSRSFKNLYGMFVCLVFACVGMVCASPAGAQNSIRVTEFNRLAVVGSDLENISLSFAATSVEPEDGCA